MSRFRRVRTEPEVKLLLLLHLRWVAVAGLAVHGARSGDWAPCLKRPPP